MFKVSKKLGDFWSFGLEVWSWSVCALGAPKADLPSTGTEVSESAGV